MGKYDYSRNIYFTKLYGNYDYYCHKQLTIKPMSITHGKGTHLVDLSPIKHINKAQLGLAGPHTHTNPADWGTRELLNWISVKREQLELPPIKPWTRVQQGKNPFSLKFHQFSSNIKLKMMWQKAGKAEKASASRCFFLLQHTQLRN